DPISSALSRFPLSRFPFRRFRLYQTLFRSDFLGAFQVFAFALSFPAVPTLSEVPDRIDRPLFPIDREGAPTTSN
ncbi:hypothetical protein, partial [Streptomyces mangrovisoli]|uniref:hypothetical protein n=1 Tax=Streptomyces mangrovisoli TaxID=1428628 RepID=UPI0019D1381A